MKYSCLDLINKFGGDWILNDHYINFVSCKFTKNIFLFGASTNVVIHCAYHISTDSFWDFNHGNGQQLNESDVQKIVKRVLKMENGLKNFS